MTPLQDKLRAAIHATAEQIPADPPPLRLQPSPRRRRRILPRLARGRPHRHALNSWIAPLAAAALVVAIVFTSLAVVAGVSKPAAGPQAGLSGVPPYYVALISPKTHPDVDDYGATAAEVRATATGAVLARLIVPKPYVSFTGVTAAADDHTFVLAAVAKSDQQSSAQWDANGYHPASSFYLLSIDPQAATPSARVALRALPASFIPANDKVFDMALSPDGHTLAADIGTQVVSSDQVSDAHLFAFDLVTGTQRAWSFQDCSGCGATSGGLGFGGGVNVDSLSWTADGRYIAFVGPGRSRPGLSAVRLLDTSVPGSNLLANSKPVVLWPGGASQPGNWRGAVVTPDGRTILVVAELTSNGSPVRVREALEACSVATGQVTKVVNNLNVLAGYDGYEQVLYTNATGSLLIVSSARPGPGLGILRGGTYTPIPWNPHTVTAAW